MAKYHIQYGDYYSRDEAFINVWDIKEHNKEAAETYVVLHYCADIDRQFNDKGDGTEEANMVNDLLWLEDNGYISVDDEAEKIYIIK